MQRFVIAAMCVNQVITTELISHTTTTNLALSSRA
jgi:hypothetical protein